jgi:cytochrome b561
MVMPSHPHQDDDATAVKESPSWQTKAVIAAIVVLVIAFIALHLAGVFGP